MNETNTLNEGEKVSVNRDANTPLYKQVYDLLKKDIQNGKYKGGDLLPSERDLSSRFDVDRITVRRSLEMLVNDGLVEKIAGLGTRVKEFPAPGMKNAANAKNIMFVLPRASSSVDRITEPFNASLFYRIERECKSREYSLIYSTLGQDDDLFKLVNGNNISGIIFVSKIEEKFYEQAMMLKIPAVLVNNKYEMYPSITADNEKGAYEAVKHLIGLGHRRIGVIRGEKRYITSIERFNGYKRALTDAGIDWQSQIVTDGDWTFDGGYNAMLKILENKDQLPTAIFAANDMTALGAIEAIKASGMSVPEDISIVGFDNIEQCKFSHPQLTTISVDTDMLGKAACQYLINAIESQQQLNIKIAIPTVLIIRNSTAEVK